MVDYKFSKVFKFVRNGASIKQGEDNTGLPITRIETIWDRSIDEEKFGYAGLHDVSDTKYEKYLLADGDILMSHINSPKHLGKCALYEGSPKKLIHGMNLLGMRPNESVARSKYLNYYFSSKAFTSQIPKIANQSVNQASFSVSKFKTLSVQLPSLAEQDKVINRLDLIDRLRQSLRAEVAAYGELGESLFLEMFGDVKLNSKNFSLAKLADLGHWRSGGTPSRRKPEYFTGEIPWLSSGELNQIYISDSNEKITDQAIMDSAAKVAEVGSLFLGMYDTAALKSTISTVPVACNQAIAFAKLDSDKCETVYVYHTIQIEKDFFRRHQRGVRQKNLNLSMVKNIKIPLPPLPLQKTFATRIAKIERLRSHAEASLAEAEDLFAAVLQESFS